MAARGRTPRRRHSSTSNLFRSISLTRRAPSLSANRKDSNHNNEEGTPASSATIFNVFGSDMVRQDFVLSQLEQVEQDTNICRLEMEECLVTNRKDAQIPLLLRKIVQESSRPWEEIRFVDEIPEGSLYRQFQATRRQFLRALDGIFIQKVIPVSYHTKVKLGKNDREEMLTLLKDFQKDKSISKLHVSTTHTNLQLILALTELLNCDERKWEDLTLHLSTKDTNITEEELQALQQAAQKLKETAEAKGLDWPGARLVTKVDEPTPPEDTPTKKKKQSRRSSALKLQKVLDDLSAQLSADQTLTEGQRQAMQDASEKLQKVIAKGKKKRLDKLRRTSTLSTTEGEDDEPQQPKKRHSTPRPDNSMQDDNSKRRSAEIRRNNASMPQLRYSPDEPTPTKRKSKRTSKDDLPEVVEEAGGEAFTKKRTSKTKKTGRLTPTNATTESSLRMVKRSGRLTPTRDGGDSSIRTNDNSTRLRDSSSRMKEISTRSSRRGWTPDDADSSVADPQELQSPIKKKKKSKIKPDSTQETEEEQQQEENNTKSGRRKVKPIVTMPVTTDDAQPSTKEQKSKAIGKTPRTSPTEETDTKATSRRHRRTNSMPDALPALEKLTQDNLETNLLWKRRASHDDIVVKKKSNGKAIKRASRANHNDNNDNEEDVVVEERRSLRKSKRTATMPPESNATATATATVKQRSSEPTKKLHARVRRAEDSSDGEDQPTKPARSGKSATMARPRRTMSLPPEKNRAN